MGQTLRFLGRTNEPDDEPRHSSGGGRATRSSPTRQAPPPRQATPAAPRDGVTQYEVDEPRSALTPAPTGPTAQTVSPVNLPLPLLAAGAVALILLLKK